MSSEPAQAFLPALLRAYWMLLGNAVVLVVALMIAQAPPWTLGWLDALFAASVAGVLASRWIDATRYGGTTADGAPTTHPLLLRWACIVVVSTAVLWLLAHSMGG